MQCVASYKVSGAFSASLSADRNKVSNALTAKQSFDGQIIGPSKDQSSVRDCKTIGLVESMKTPPPPLSLFVAFTLSHFSPLFHLSPSKKCQLQ